MARAGLGRAALPLLLVTALAPVAVSCGEERARRYPVDTLCPLDDAVEPVISGVRLSSSEVDVTEAGASVGIRIDVQDRAQKRSHPSGVGVVEATFSSPGDELVDPVRLMRSDTGRFWTGRFEVPRGTYPGHWDLTAVSGRDRNNNATAPPVARFPAGWSRGFQVTSNAPDVHPPEVHNLTVTVNGEENGTTSMAFVLHATDDFAVTGASVGLDTPEDEYIDGPVHTELVADGPGRFTGVLLAPSGLRKGRYGLNLVVRDANNFVALDAEELTRRGISSSVELDRRVDSTLPQLIAMTATPTTVDARSRTRSVRLSIQAADAGAGVGSVRVLAIARTSKEQNNVGFGEQGERLRQTEPDSYSADLRLVNGDASLGTWAGALKFPRCARAGAYRIFPSVVDRQLNDVSPSGPELAALGLPELLQVRSRAPRMVGPDATARLVAPDRVRIEYTRGVVNVTRRNVLVLDYDGGRHRTHGLLCLDVSGRAVRCSGTDGLVRVARLTVRPPLPKDLSWVVHGFLPVHPLVTEPDGTRVNTYLIAD